MTSREQLDNEGFAIIENVFSNTEIENIISVIQSADMSKATFRKTEDLFAIRQFFKAIPEIAELVFTTNFKRLIYDLLGEGFFVVKSIYFDKPPKSNWFVAYHQDLTISVDKKMDIPGYGPWTVKQDQFAVQPPLDILQSIYTLRIHLDDTDENNGVLKVIPGSHRKGICRANNIDWTQEREILCPVSKGGVMLMRPLLLHSSARSTNHNQRRVIHVEVSNEELVVGLQWVEKAEIL